MISPPAPPLKGLRWTTRPSGNLGALTAAGCRKVFADKQSGGHALCPELTACHAFLDPGDTLVVPSLDRYGRSLQGLIQVKSRREPPGSSPALPDRTPAPPLRPAPAARAS
ncbi:recombinase family protein [Streptomyces sp. NPDC004051]